MSSTRNPNSLTPAQGEFKPAIEPSEPLTTKGHQPGRKAAPGDHAPTFSAQVLQPGSAPADSTFTPNIQSLGEQTTTAETTTSAADTLGGVDSAQVHTGLGHPGQGQTSAELRHDGEKHRHKAGAGLQGVGAQEESIDGLGTVNERTNVDQRALKREEGVYAGQRGDKSTLGAEERPPSGTDEVAS